MASKSEIELIVIDDKGSDFALSYYLFCLEQAEIALHQASEIIKSHGVIRNITDIKKLRATLADVRELIK